MSSRRWSERVEAGVSALFEPPRQVWLAWLGGMSLALRGARSAWSHAVAEGAAVEAWLRRSPGATDPHAR